MEQVGLIVGIMGGVLGVIGTAFAVFFGMKAYGRTKNQDVAQGAGTTAQISSSIEYIKEGIKDIQKEQRLIREDVGALSQRVAKLEGAFENHLNQH